MDHACPVSSFGNLTAHQRLSPPQGLLIGPAHNSGHSVVSAARLSSGVKMAALGPVGKVSTPSRSRVVLPEHQSVAQLPASLGLELTRYPSTVFPGAGRSSKEWSAGSVSCFRTEGSCQGSGCQPTLSAFVAPGLSLVAIGQSWTSGRPEGGKLWNFSEYQLSPGISS